MKCNGARPRAMSGGRHPNGVNKQVNGVNNQLQGENGVRAGGCDTPRQRHGAPLGRVELRVKCGQVQ